MIYAIIFLLKGLCITVQFECWGCWCGLLLSGPSLPALFFPSCQISPHLFIHSSYLRPVWHCCNDSPWEMYNWICKFPHGSLLFNVCSWVSTVCMADWKRVKIWIISVLFPWLYYYVVAKKKRTSKMVQESYSCIQSCKIYAECLLSI